MGKKKKTLPANFAELVKTNDISALKEVFELCEWDARGGYSKVPPSASGKYRMRWFPTCGAGC